jgi:hypothetical protein
VAQIYVAGPCEIHVGVGTAGSLVFLGWSEAGVRISIQPGWDDVPSDLAGSRVPHDVQAMGEQAFISYDLKVWNESVYAQCAARWNPFTGPRGVQPVGAVGGLMVTEGAAYRLLVYSPYAALKPSQAAQSHYNFFRSWVAGPDDIAPVGTRAKKIRIVHRAIGSYDPLTGGWPLYDGSAAGKPAVN